MVDCCRDPSDRVRSLKREVEALYQNNVRPGSNRKLDTEVFEMSKFNDKLNKFDEHNKFNDTSNKFERKRQLWLSSCSQESGTSADATYGRFAKDLEPPLKTINQTGLLIISDFRAFVAPVLPNTRRPPDDMRNLIDDI